MARARAKRREAMERGLWRCLGKRSARAEALGYGRRLESSGLFFTAQAFEHQKSVGGDAQGGVMVEAAPVTPFVVRQAELGLELLVVAFDHPAPHGIEDQLSEGGRVGQRRQPVMTRLGLTVRPFDQEPLLGPRQIAVRRAHPHAGKARRQPALRAVAPAHRAPALRRQGSRHAQHRHRLVASIARDSLRGRSPLAAPAGPG